MNTTVDFEADGPAGLAIAAYLNGLDERGKEFRPAVRQEVLAKFADAQNALLAYFADEDRLESGREAILDRKTTADEGSIIRYVGDYALLEHIGTGGMGTVYRARQSTTGRIVAVKLVRNSSPEMLERFRREAQAIANLRHPNIVTLFEAGEHEGEFYYSMDYIANGCLSRKIRAERPSPQQAAEWTRSIAGALDYAHSKGILHRDIKPQNILLDEQQNPLIADFGLAKIMQDGKPWEQSRAIVGTFAYMPPEQAQAADSKLSPASDVYSLGATLYEMLTGEPPIQGDNEAAIIQNLVTREPKSPRLLNPAIPIDLATVCLKCLSKEPERRYTTAGELADDLYRFKNGQGVKARPLTAFEAGVRWGRRNPLLLSLFLSIAASLVIGTTVSLGLYRLATDRATSLSSTNATLHQKVVELDTTNHSLEQTVAELNASRRAEEQAKQQIELQTEERRKLTYNKSLLIASKLLSESQPEARVLLEDEEACPPEHRDLAWRFLSRQVRGELQSWYGHRAPIHAIALSPAGDELVSVNGNGEFRIHRTTDGQLLKTIYHRKSQVHALAWSPDGQYFFSGAEDGSVFAWERQSPDSPKCLVDHGDSITSIATARDTPVVIAISASGRLLTWNTNTWGHSSIYVEGSFRGSSPLAASCDGTLAIIGTNDRGILLVNLQSKKVERMSNPNRGLLGLGLFYNSAFTSIVSVEVLDANTILACDSDGMLWNFDLAKRQSTYAGALKDSYLDDANKLRGSVCAMGTEGGDLVVVDPSAEIPTRKFRGHSLPINAIDWSPDGSLIYTASDDMTIRVWGSAKEAESLQLVSDDGRRISQCADGTTFIQDDAGIVVRLPPASSQLCDALDLSSSHRMAAVSGDGKHLVAVDDKSELSLWSVKEQSRISTIASLGQFLGFSRDYNSIFYSISSTIHCYDIAARKNSYSCVLPAGIDAFAVATENDLLCATTNNGDLTIIESLTGRVVSSGRFFLHSLAISPDGTCIAGWTPDQKILVFDSLDLELVRELKVPEGTVDFIVFGANSHSIVAATSQGRISFWDVSSTQELGTIETGHRIAQLELSADASSITFQTQQHKVYRCNAVQFESDRYFDQLVGSLITPDSSWKNVLARLEVRADISSSERLAVQRAAKVRWRQQTQSQARRAALSAGSRFVLKAERIQAIENDLTLNPDAREAALAIVSVKPEQTTVIAKAAWQIVKVPLRSNDEYREGQRLAAALVEASRAPRHLTILAAAYVRLGELDKARELLEPLLLHEIEWLMATVWLCLIEKPNSPYLAGHLAEIETLEELSIADPYYSPLWETIYDESDFQKLRDEAFEVHATAKKLLANTGDLIYPAQGSRHVGKSVTVEGQIRGSTSISGKCVLTFIPIHRAMSVVESSRVVIAMPNESVAWFPRPPNEYFLGKRVRVTGTIRRVYLRTDFDLLQMNVTKASQIQVVGDRNP